MSVFDGHARAWHSRAEQLKRRCVAQILRAMALGRQIAPLAAMYHLLPAVLRARMKRVLIRGALGTNTGLNAAHSAREPIARSSEQANPNVCGVNLIGHVRGEFGLGQSVRLAARMLDSADYPFCLLNYEAGMPGSLNDASLAAWIEQVPRYPISIFFINPDCIQPALAHLREDGASWRYTIGYWFWELETFPAAWRDAFAHVDEVWVATEFVRCAVAAATEKPVRVMPLPALLPVLGPSQRADFSLPEHKFIFLCMFDFYSYFERKNPVAAIAAFRAAFPRGRDDVRLVIKTIHGDRMADAFEQTAIAVAADPRIMVHDGHLSTKQVAELIGHCDALVSLHRAEGLGLALIEAMALGKPVIATAYSGNMDFMSENDALLIGYRRVGISPGAYPHAAGQQWAEPDVAQAAAAMRALADDRAYAKRLGQTARERIQQQYAPSVCAQAMARRIREIEAMTAQAC